MKSSNQSWKQSQTDGVIDSTVAHQAHEDRIYVEQKHNAANRRKILEQNAAIRRENPFRPEVTRGHKLILSIPQGDMMSLRIQYPDLDSNVMSDKARAYKAIAAAHPEYIQWSKL